MCEAEQGVREAAERGAVLTLSVGELHPQRVLEILAEGGRSHRLTIEIANGSITVELGNGLVVGAEAAFADGDSSGRAAYARIRGLVEGSMRIEPLRFPSLANILQPVAQMPDLERSTLPPPAGDDTIELALPEARPIHPPPAPEPATVEVKVELTVEMELPDDAEELTAAPRASAPPPPIPAPALPTLMPATREHSAPPARRRGLGVAAAAAAALLGLAGAGWAMMPSASEAAPGGPIAATTPELVEAEAGALEDDDSVDMDLSDHADQANDLAEARQLARAARAHLRDGDRASALTAARRAAELRGGMPYYQVLLGDALRANGQRAAAQRAYRRAVRLRPRYGPAMRRLGRSASRDRELPTSQT